MTSIDSRINSRINSRITSRMTSSVDIQSTRSNPNDRNGASIPDNGVASGNTTRRQVSTFDISHLSDQPIRTRELHEYFVHYSASTSSWTTRIASCGAEDRRRDYLNFSFPREEDGRKFGKAYSPPKMMSGSNRCACCSVRLNANSTCSSCKNCGVQVCESCTRRWGVNMIPTTYLGEARMSSSSTVRVCKSCDWLSNAFCMALFRGEHNNAVLLHATGNINLRCVFADIHKEAMFPIHCAVMGGNIDIVKWLIEAHGCPIFMKRRPHSADLQSLQTSKKRTLMDLVMNGRPKIEVLAYLVGKNLSVTDTDDPNLASKTLQTILRAENQSGGRLFGSNNCSNASVSTEEDSCIICCEQQKNCVLSPCGHQVCCSDCGHRLSECPICKQSCNALRIFKS